MAVGLSRRKGSLLDIPFIVMVIFAFSFLIIISAVIITEFRDANTDGNLGMDENLINNGIAAIAALDVMFIFATIGLGLATIILSFQIRTHPIMFFFALLLTVLFVIITVFFTNAYVLITEQEALSTAVLDFPLLDSVMKNLPLIMAVIMLLLILALYMGKRGDVGV